MLYVVPCVLRYITNDTLVRPLGLSLLCSLGPKTRILKNILITLVRPRYHFAVALSRAIGQNFGVVIQYEK